MWSEGVIGIPDAKDKEKYTKCYYWVKHYDEPSETYGILYYQDVDSLVYWANEAAYRWGVRGFAMWSLGQEDMRLWEALPKQI